MGWLIQSGLYKGHLKIINNPDNSLEPGKKNQINLKRIGILAELVNWGRSQLGLSKGRSTFSVLLN